MYLVNDKQEKISVDFGRNSKGEPGVVIFIGNAGVILTKAAAEEIGNAVLSTAGGLPNPTFTVLSPDIGAAPHTRADEEIGKAWILDLPPRTC